MSDSVEHETPPSNALLMGEDEKLDVDSDEDTDDSMPELDEGFGNESLPALEEDGHPRIPNSHTTPPRNYRRGDAGINMLANMMSHICMGGRHHRLHSVHTTQQGHSGLERKCDSKTSIKKIESKPVFSINNSQLHGGGDITSSITITESMYTCGVCCDRINGEIIMCDNRHSLCITCVEGIIKANSKLKECPICRDTNFHRAFIVEQIMLTFVKSCENEGCAFTGYEEDLDVHKPQCQHATIKCIWCKKDSTVYDFKFHALTECSTKFTTVNCSGVLNFIKSDTMQGGMVIKSLMDDSRYVYIEKNKDTVNFICIQGNEVSSDGRDILELKYTKKKRCLGGVILENNESVSLLVHKPKNLNNGDVVVHSIPLASMLEYTNISVNGIKEPYTIGERLIVQSNDGDWYKGTVTARNHSPDRVTFACYDATNTRFQLQCTVELTDGQSDRIRLPKYLTTSERHATLRMLSDDDRIQVAIKESNGEHMTITDLENARRQYYVRN
jgi:hypothetical protein